MDSYKWGKGSLEELNGIHPDLRKVADLALKLATCDFRIVDGLRTMEEQRRYVASGASKTMKSRHLTGHAVDFVALPGGKASYNEAAMTKVADAFKAAARSLGIPIEWGGDWKSFVDTPHIELSKKVYP